MVPSPEEAKTLREAFALADETLRNSPRGDPERIFTFYKKILKRGPVTVKHLLHKRGESHHFVLYLDRPNEAALNCAFRAQALTIAEFPMEQVKFEVKKVYTKTAQDVKHREDQGYRDIWGGDHATA